MRANPLRVAPPHPAGVPSPIGALVLLVAALALVAVVITGRPMVRLARGDDADEARAIADLVRFALLEDAVRDVAFVRVSPEVLADPGRRIPLLASGGVRMAVEPRFLQAERDGYRFFFDGTPFTRFPAPVTPAYDDVTYVAVPLDPASRARTFAYHSRAGRRIFARTDRRQPTPDDPVAREWE
jgi:hypothetical protein